ncbi:MAG: hypothetical protein KJ607_14175, partial [Bacteroidetes bacterium]|nr:hypothetical protein [Bacteroidota bacterium]
MKTARLEIDKIKILKRGERWRLYFIITVTDPVDPSEQTVYFNPIDFPIETFRNQGNEIVFNKGGIGEEGRILFVRNIPESNVLSVSIYVFHSREKARNISEMAHNMQGSTGGKLLK